MDFRFEKLAQGNINLLDGLVTIYQEAIDPSEQKSISEVSAMLQDARYDIIVCSLDGTVIGFAICFFPDAADYWLLEYMAVAASGRGKRIGEAIFLHAYIHGQQRDSKRVMVLEVDQPGGATRPGNDTEARLRFYKRLGCSRILGLNYDLPLETEQEPPLMMLLTYCAPALHAIHKRRLEQWLTSLYVDVYGKRGDDPRISEMMRQLPEPVLLQPL